MHASSRARRRVGGRPTRRIAAAGSAAGANAGSGSSSDPSLSPTPSPTSSSTSPPRDFRFCIDRGGTFTDVYAEVPGPTPDAPGSFRTLKLLSEDPANYESAPREGIRRILEEVTGEPIPRDAPVPTARIEWIRMGTTVATNALLERDGARSALLVTEGFEDLLAIGNQARPDIFDLKIEKPSRLYEEVVEVGERVRVLADDEDADALVARGSDVRVGVTGEKILVERAVDVEALRPRLRALLDAGVRSLAVVLLHSYTFREHEDAVGALAAEMGFEQISLSSALVPMARAVPRGHTASVDAYLTPCIREYLRAFLAGFDDGLSEVKVSFMQSDGGLTPAERFTGYKAILSGPAGGVVGYATTTSAETSRACIGFDMGGTSTDVSRFDGAYEQVTETETAGVTIQAPQLDITTVAAGGGSKLTFRSGTFRVGPESVGSEPGPVCYRKGGESLSVTDANVVLGRVLPEYFPKIFGESEDQPLDADAARRAFDEETVRINEALERIHAETTESEFAPLTTEEVALGYLRVANEAMCRPIREITESKGFDTASHVLAAFGGAGPQHACAIARSLGIRTVFVHRFCGILSAYGMGMADVVAEAQRPFAGTLGEDRAGEDVAAAVAELEARVVAQLDEQGFTLEPSEGAPTITTETLLNLRYEGTDTAIMTPEPDDGDFAAAFGARFRREYGFELEGRDLVVDDVRVRGVGKSELLRRVRVDGSGDGEEEDALPPPDAVSDVYFEGGWRATPVFLIDRLRAGDVVEGPAVIMNGTATCVVEPGCVAELTAYGDLKIDVDVAGDSTAAGKDDAAAAAAADLAGSRRPDVVTSPDAVQLSIFNNRFMGIAEQMGRTLQRTSVSTNIKERLDFSCALFGPEGGLVANAPHVPVHLGAMSSTVRWQLEHWCGPGGEGLREGDVLVTNHPRAGGSHLPDITVVTPVFRDGVVVFFVASRGHHADVGGITPGSMPPFSRSIADEGAAIKAFKLVDAGAYQERGMVELLTKPETGSPGTRKLADNLSDLNAQVAANRRGIALIDELIDEYGLEEVQAYMGFVQENAELAVRDMLREYAGRLIDERGGSGDEISLASEDRMDDGSVIRLRLTLNRAEGTAVFDFTGTSAEVHGNWNAPPAVTSAAVIYCVRCLVNQEIPLNEGCLKPIRIVVPEGTFLSPSESAAVVGGNVLTSQRVTDVCLSAFGACADSQGCMNNLTFGDETFGYYETIGGGAGAGPDWNGASGTQCHMTNTRITDPEILERRYPVALRRFGIRRGSGGAGATRGGDGLIREIEFLRPVTVSVLTERRVFAPRGARGGGDGAGGVNSLFVEDGDTSNATNAGIEGERGSIPGRRMVNLGGKNSVAARAGDILRILTPGGGGYGSER